MTIKQKFWASHVGMALNILLGNSTISKLNIKNNAIDVENEKHVIMKNVNFCFDKNKTNNIKNIASGCGPGKGDVHLYKIVYHCGCVGYVSCCDHSPYESFCLEHYKSYMSIKACSFDTIVKVLLEKGVIQDSDLFN